MTQYLLDRVLLPVADPDDAADTVDAIAPYIDAAGSTLTVVHVTEDTETARDISEETRSRLFDPFRTAFGDSHSIETAVLAGDDITAEIATAANEFGASSIGLLPRPRNHLLRLLSKEKTTRLIGDTSIPVVVFPDPADRNTVTMTTDSDGQWTPKILAPISEEGDFSGVTYACTGFANSTLTIIHVLSPDGSDMYSEMTGSISGAIGSTGSEERTRASRLLSEAESIAADHGIEVTSQLLVGDVTESILATADDEACEVLVLPSADDSRSDWRVLEGTAAQLITESPIPLVFV